MPDMTICPFCRMSMPTSQWPQHFQSRHSLQATTTSNAIIPNAATLPAQASAPPRRPWVRCPRCAFMIREQDLTEHMWQCQGRPVDEETEDMPTPQREPAYEPEGCQGCVEREGSIVSMATSPCAGVYVNECGCAEWHLSCEGTRLADQAVRGPCFVEQGRQSFHGWCPENGRPPASWLRYRGITEDGEPAPPRRYRHTCEDSVITYACGCQEFCPLHAVERHRTQTERTNQNRHHCWVEMGRQRVHGWRTQIGQSPLVLRTPEVPMEICVRCEQTGIWASPYCGCLEWCATCQRQNYLGQIVKLGGCWRNVPGINAAARDSGMVDANGEWQCHGWLNSNGTMPPPTPNCGFCGGSGVDIQICGCETWCPRCNKRRHGVSTRLIGQPCWVDNGFGLREHGWNARLGPRPGGTVKRINLIISDEELSEKRETASSLTMLARSGHIHKVDCKMWPERKLMVLQDFASHMGCEFHEDVGVLGYPRTLMSREAAIAKHGDMLKALKHPINIQVNKPVIPVIESYDREFSVGDHFLDRFGLELEGNWLSAPPLPVHGDGSVQKLLKHSGEVRTLTYAASPDWEGAIRPSWPDKSDASCGMHCHISFKSKGIYSMFACKQFFDWLGEQLLAYGRKTKIKQEDYFKRLEGNNRYCQNKYDPDGQIIGHGDRYCRINYCWQRHKTIEVRVLPMFHDYQEGKRVVMFMLACFDLWAAANYKQLISVEKVSATSHLAKAAAAVGKAVFLK